ncbi:ankyrin repeat protein, partial [Peniophora sp. CONT]
LHRAVRNADETLVRSLLEQPADIEALDVHGSTALFIAADYGLVGIARVLVERGATVNAECRERPDLRPWTVLQIAAMNGHSDIVRLLLEYGADVNGHGEGVPPPLSEAVFEGRVDAARILLEQGAHLVLRPDDQLTALHVAASS